MADFFEYLNFRQTYCPFESAPSCFLGEGVFCTLSLSSGGGSSSEVTAPGGGAGLQSGQEAEQQLLAQRWQINNKPTVSSALLFRKNREQDVLQRKEEGSSLNLCTCGLAQIDQAWILN